MILAGDIGGTQTRLALFSGPPLRPQTHDYRHLASGGTKEPEAQIEEFLADRGDCVDAACLAVAGPLVDGRVRLTNLPWTLVADRLAHRFGWRRCILLNDLEATAHALPMLGPDKFEALRPPPDHADGNVAILAPGTGLGAVLALRRGDAVRPLASEAGHADFAPVDEESLSLWRYIARRKGRVPLESILSGRGLQRIYRWRRHLGDTHPDPATGEGIENAADPSARISELALARQDPVCVRALACFVRCLGAAAGNLALTATTRAGLYLAGGIAPKILPELHSGGFEEAFLDKGGFRGLLETVPVHVILDESAPLLGAARTALTAAAGD